MSSSLLVSVFPIVVAVCASAWAQQNGQEWRLWLGLAVLAYGWWLWLSEKLLGHRLRLSEKGKKWDECPDGISYSDAATKMIYCTDVEGHWPYFVNFVQNSSGVLRFIKTDIDMNQASLEDVELKLLDDWVFVFGGDSCDKGPGTLRFLKCITQLKEKYPGRVWLLLGNRDINKMRWTSEFTKSALEHWDLPAAHWVAEKSRVTLRQFLTRLAADGESVKASELTEEMLQKYNTAANHMRYHLRHDMGSDGDFEFRRQELKHLKLLRRKRSPTKRQKDCVPASDEDLCISDDEVMKSYVDSVGPSGLMRKYIEQAQLAVMIDGTLFVHGQIIGREPKSSGQGVWSIGIVPGEPNFLPSARKWLVKLNAWGKKEVADWIQRPTWETYPVDSNRINWRGRGGADLMAYGTPDSHCIGVVYTRYLSDSSMPIQYPQRLVEHLVLNGIHRVVVGHTPHGNAPTVVQHIGLTLVMGDTSFSDTNCNAAFSGDNRGDAVSCIEIDTQRNFIHVTGRLQNDTSKNIQRVLDYKVVPLGHPSSEIVPDPYVGRQDGQVMCDLDGADGEKFFVKAKLPSMPALTGEKESYHTMYLLCSIDGYRVVYREVTREQVQEYTQSHVGNIMTREAPRHNSYDFFGDNHPDMENKTIEFLFETLDMDNDGKITRDELQKACAQQYVRKMWKHVFPGMDLDTIWMRLDADGDGQISMDELSACLSKCPDAPKMKRKKSSFSF